MVLSILKDGKQTQSPAEDILFDQECDLLCIGIGSAGSYATLAAAREGLKVIAVEKDANLGGMAVNGRVTYYYYGFQGGTFEANDKAGEAHRQAFYTGQARNNSDLMQIMLYSSLKESGAGIMTNAIVTGVYIENNNVVGARIFQNGKTLHIRSKMLVDATSDGHVIRMCPVNTYWGREIDGKPVPFTIRCDLMDTEYAYRANNTDSGYCNQYQTSEFSQKIITGRSARRHKVEPKQQLISTAPICGVREGIRYEGEETLRYSDILLGNYPEKVLFYAYSDIDKHGHDLALDDELYQNWWVISNLATITVRIPVPFGSVVPKGLGGIVTAGRCLSIDSYSSSAVRMNRDMFRMGECVGIAAAMAIRSGCAFTEIDYEKFIQKVEHYGCYSGDPQKIFGFDEKNGKFPYEPIDFKMGKEQILALLSTDAPGPAIWSAYQYGNEELAQTLIEKLSGEDGHLKYNSAIALGIMGRKEGLGVLRQLVSNRSGFFFQDCRRSNQFRSVIAICLLGRVGEKEDIDLLSPIVMDDTEFDREMYKLWQRTPLVCNVASCNYLLFQHFTHAAVAMHKLGKKHGVDLGTIFEKRFSGDSRDRILKAITTESATGALYTEVSDLMQHILSNL